MNGTEALIALGIITTGFTGGAIALYNKQIKGRKQGETEKNDRGLDKMVGEEEHLNKS